MVVIFLWVLMVQNMPKGLHQFLRKLLILMRVLDDLTTDHAESCEHDGGFLVIQCLDRERLNLGQVVLECLMYVVECEVGLPADYRSSVADELPQDGNDMANQVVREEVPEEGKRRHNDESILILEVLNDCVVHKQAELVSRFDQECCEQI